MGGAPDPSTIMVLLLAAEHWVGVCANACIQTRRARTASTSKQPHTHILRRSQAQGRDVLPGPGTLATRNLQSSQWAQCELKAGAAMAWCMLAAQTRCDARQWRRRNGAGSHELAPGLTQTSAYGSYMRKNKPTAGKARNLQAQECCRAWRCTRCQQRTMTSKQVHRSPLCSALDPRGGDSDAIIVRHGLVIGALNRERLALHMYARKRHANAMSDAQHLMRVITPPPTCRTRTLQGCTRREASC